ncbi:beta-1,3-galactosyltransferase 1 [Papilio machaon]|uniref:beta-1,3-galactosyltransferase 1 n=1 Tax=Papilio machaon TaxID=76193 RepID=UPI001E665923|nr:beta-1,3-galactosyltransferase 1 [Papilio machaon]
MLVIKMVRRKGLVLGLLLLASMLAALPAGWWFARAVSRGLMLPAPPPRDLTHYMRTKSLRDYLIKIDILIEPTRTSCDTLSNIPVLVMVISAPMHFDYRNVIRKTWAKYQPTLFIMGTHRTHSESILGGNYLESKQFNDILVFDFYDQYQNLTLKTALMLKWASERCPQVKFLFKTDDDVLVNPWILQRVIKDHPHAQLLGYSINKTKLHRDEYNKYYVPRWLSRDDLIPQYLSGTGYLINGAYMKKILYTAYLVPMVNMEDVYITYLVAKKTLNLTLTHDRRVSPMRPLVTLSCLYWHLAAAHSVRPSEILKIWPNLKIIGKEYNRKKKVCYGYEFFNKDLFLY